MYTHIHISMYVYAHLRRLQRASAPTALAAEAPEGLALDGGARDACEA